MSLKYQTFVWIRGSLLVCSLAVITRDDITNSYRHVRRTNSPWLRVPTLANLFAFVFRLGLCSVVVNFHLFSRPVGFCRGETNHKTQYMCVWCFRVRRREFVSWHRTVPFWVAKFNRGGEDDRWAYSLTWYTWHSAPPSIFRVLHQGCVFHGLVECGVQYNNHLIVVLSSPPPQSSRFFYFVHTLFCIYCIWWRQWPAIKPGDLGTNCCLPPHKQHSHRNRYR